MSSESAEHVCHCYKNSYSNSLFPIIAFVFSSHSCCGAGEEEDELMAGENGWSFCFLPFSICWAFWGPAESVHAWQVWLLPSVHDGCATLSVCQHPPAPLPPYLAQNLAAEREMSCVSQQNDEF